MGPGVLSNLLKDLRHIPDERLIVGFESNDDAAVYRLDNGLYLIHTLDFFPPVVDDPYEFGQIAAANSLSDIYAMGGTPVSALNIFCLPPDMDCNTAKTILAGGNDKVLEAGINITGGHSLSDSEPKYGLSVTGIAREDELIFNKGARAGDVLLLTKPLGSGVLVSALRKGELSDRQHRDLVEVMSLLNRRAAEAARKYEVHAGTDITGFGLLGHVAELAEASKVTVAIDAKAVPMMPEALELARAGFIPGGTGRNKAYLEGRYRVDKDIEKEYLDILFDPQTSGGLCLAMLPQEARELREILRKEGLTAEIVGEVLAHDKYSVVVK